MTQDEIKQAWEDATGSCWPDEGCFTAGEYDYHILSFANKICNAALEEAINACNEYAAIPKVDSGVPLAIANKIGLLK